MVKFFGVIVAVCAIWYPTLASASCPTPEDGTGKARVLSPTVNEDIDLTLSMSMMPKLMHLDYKGVSSSTLPCTLSKFKAGEQDYTLQATESERGTGRRAMSDAKGKPIAEIVPVTNIIAAMEASKQGKSAGVSGYMLITLDKHTITGWRFYTGLPNQEVLVADITAALTSGLPRLFAIDNATGKSSIFVHP
ncbi:MULTISPECIES: hypothetical protein [unclassified Sphingomonas]|uniref:hypothetical protein n=1 Tax=unclassified Sphingomonas TaxID=196159 RepID=UPI00226A4773|nr:MULTISPECIES: hypothetical protein [unclassified Sphingomonas]